MCATYPTLYMSGIHAQIAGNFVKKLSRARGNRARLAPHGRRRDERCSETEQLRIECEIAHTLLPRPATGRSRARRLIRLPRAAFHWGALPNARRSPTLLPTSLLIWRISLTAQ